MRVAIVINPISGSRGRASAAAGRMARARRLAIDHPSHEVEIVATSGPGHAVELSRGFATRNFDIVMAWGGDGTANEVAGPLIGTATALGIIPSGSGDGLARGLKLERDVEAAFVKAIAGRATALDVGYLGERHFLNVAGIGFDALIASDFNKGRRRGALGYIARIPPMLWRYESQWYEIRLDEQLRQGRHLLIAFSNGPQYGNHMVLAPQADPRDGWLDVVLVDEGSRWQQLWRARRLALAPGRPTRGIIRTRARTAAIAGERLQCHVDGEAFEAHGSIAVRIAPQALKVCGVT